jgi:hypothetical protein
VVVAQVDQVTTRLSHSPASRADGTALASRGCRCPGPRLASPGASARWSRCRASRPRPPASTPRARDALLSSRRPPAAPRLGFSAATLSSSQSNAEGASERHSMACRVRRLMGWPHLLGRRPPCPITDTAVWELFEHTGDVESRQGQHDAPPVNVIVDDAAAHTLIQQILDAPALTLSEQGRDRDRQYDPHFGLLSCCAMPRLHTPEGDTWRVAPGRVRAAAAAAAGRTGCLPPLPYRPLSLSIAGQVGKGSDG